jgi:hypothetical protein
LADGNIVEWVMNAWAKATIGVRTSIAIMEKASADDFLLI